ncbi:MAG: hypothetical protein ACPGVU_16550, partial [Limisphaerales bacterium]
AETIELADDVRFLDTQAAELPTIKSLVRARFDVASQRLLPTMTSFIGAALEELPDELGGSGSALRRDFDRVEKTARDRIGQ